MPPIISYKSGKSLKDDLFEGQRVATAKPHLSVVLQLILRLAYLTKTTSDAIFGVK